MGLLNLFSKPTAELVRLPSGSFTVDRDGRILMGTLPSNFPRDMVKDLAQLVLETFREAAEAQLPLSEVIANFPSLRITARELRGGAIVFLSPRERTATPNLN